MLAIDPTAGHHQQQLLRSLPAVHRLLVHPLGRQLVDKYGHNATAEALGAVLAEARAAILAADPAAGGGQAVEPIHLIKRAQAHLERLNQPKLRRVINATGIVLHTNLGRSRLAPSALRAVAEAAGNYTTLEYDLDAGGRGSRHNIVRDWLRHLTGAEDAMAVNNNAGAVLLALASLAAGREVVVSRGELVEIGGSFRVPEVIAQGGCRLIEVGTTNRTRLSDFERALGPETGALLKVHTSNYRIVGFAEAVAIADLVRLARHHDLPVVYDLGSGGLVDLAARGIGDDPTVQAAIAAGADLVTFSGDKLLGGPQAGIIVGREDLIARCRQHPLARALRLDKLALAALEATLRLYWDEQQAISNIPTLRMLFTDTEQLRQRADAVKDRLRSQLRGHANLLITTERTAAPPGGGSLPGITLPGYAVALNGSDSGLVVRIERKLRSLDPAVIARIAHDRLLLDLRSVDATEDELLVLAVVTAVNKSVA